MSEVNTVNKRGTEGQWRWNTETGKDAILKNIHNVEIDVQSHCTKKAMTQISSPKAHPLCVQDIVFACQNGVT